MIKLVMTLVLCLSVFTAYSFDVALPDTPDLEKALTTPKANKQGSKTLKEGKLYTHSSGSKFRIPTGWSVREVEGALMLVPGDATVDENYAIMMSPAQGATDVTAPNVIAALDAQVKQLAPTATRVSEPQSISSGVGKGVLLVYEAEANGTLYQLRGYVTIYKDNAISVLGLGPKMKVLKRDKDLREIFASLGWGQGESDKALIGRWLHYDYKETSRLNDTRGGNEVQIEVTLKADNTFTYNSNVDYSYWGGGVGIGNRTGNGWKGTWTAGQGQIILHFDDGTANTYNYRLTKKGGEVVLMVRAEKSQKELQFLRKG